MAVIRTTAKWSEERKRYIPDKNVLEGDGNIKMTKEFLEGADPEFIQVNGDIITIAPYKMRILSQDANGIIECELVS